jgi:hypothetical protein
MARTADSVAQSNEKSPETHMAQGFVKSFESAARVRDTLGRCPQSGL